jgi:hypothetical protein
VNVEYRPDTGPTGLMYLDAAAICLACWVTRMHGMLAESTLCVICRLSDRQVDGRSIPLVL